MWFKYKNPNHYLSATIFLIFRTITIITLGITSVVCVIMMDVIRVEEIELDTNNLSPTDVERLRSLLPQELQKSEKLSQLEIILEAIHYIKMLQTRLKTISEY